MSESIATLRDQIVHEEITAGAATESALHAAEKLNGTLNAFLEIDREGALDRAETIDATIKSIGDKPALSAMPLAGVPIAVKDNICVRGLQTSCGSISPALQRNRNRSVNRCGFGDYWQDKLR